MYVKIKVCFVLCIKYTLYSVVLGKYKITSRVRISEVCIEYLFLIQCETAIPSVEQPFGNWSRETVVRCAAVDCAPVRIVVRRGRGWEEGPPIRRRRERLRNVKEGKGERGYF